MSHHNKLAGQCGTPAITNHLGPHTRQPQEGKGRPRGTEAEHLSTRAGRGPAQGQAGPQDTQGGKLRPSFSLGPPHTEWQWAAVTTNPFLLSPLPWRGGHCAATAPQPCTGLIQPFRAAAQGICAGTRGGTERLPLSAQPGSCSHRPAQGRWPLIITPSLGQSPHKCCPCLCMLPSH